ncbi:hypothetical protein JRQ81_014004 [Phrynocephalus forsythii]|uniref:Uncharacterized protein n=1 Tax=Phrynocephalus forsythii TaxID=171643 RepID=A0A9Q0XVV5_9SAUR|nr:hypothetical protein JRQ81_014004 [Phrynocephalus forsythii]
MQQYTTPGKNNSFPSYYEENVLRKQASQREVLADDIIITAIRKIPGFQLYDPWLQYTIGLITCKHFLDGCVHPFTYFAAKHDISPFRGTERKRREEGSDRDGQPSSRPGSLFGRAIGGWVSPWDTPSAAENKTAPSPFRASSQASSGGSETSATAGKSPTREPLPPPAQPPSTAASRLQPPPECQTGAEERSVAFARKLCTLQRRCNVKGTVSTNPASCAWFVRRT